MRVTLVSFGEIPLPQQTSWMQNLHGLDYRPTAFRLEWMQEGEEDLEDSCNYLQSVIRDVRPDILHRSEERRVGKESRSRGETEREKKRRRRTTREQRRQITGT